MEKTLETREQVEKLKQRLQTKKRGISETENISGGEETAISSEASELVNDAEINAAPVVCDDVPIQLPINDNNK